MAILDPDLRALQEVRDQVARARAAADAVREYSQEQIDHLCKRMADAGASAAYDLARLAVEETGIGRVHYKVLKNLLGSEGTWESIAREKTVGVIDRDASTGVVQIATPVGVVAAIVPTTNPTSTAMNKALISIKGRNAVVISPHPRAKRCIGETVEVLRRAIERAGGPPDLVCCLSNPTLESTGALMKHRDVAMILATGGAGLVQAAYSSGKPAYGVGPGNVPCYIDRTADIAKAAKAVTASQSFDNATLCCSEQALVLDKPIADRMIGELVGRGAHLCDADETAKLEVYANRGGHMNPDLVGLDPWRVAEAAGFNVPRHTTILLAHQSGVGKCSPLSIEILCPLLSIHLVDGWREGCKVSLKTLHYGGLGHTLAFWANDEEVIETFLIEKPANRIVVNGPSSQGATGYSTGLVPAMSLGCGPEAGNITSDNITAKHLINIKRAAYLVPTWEETEARDHARASALTGEPAPRGSGLRGDPALSQNRENTLGSTGMAAARHATLTPASPPLPPGGSQGGGMQSKVQPAAKSQPIPSFARPTGPASGAPVASPRPAAAALRPAAKTTHSKREAISAHEIQAIMENAGQGCPLGPCNGCPHHEVTTGACKA